MNCNSCMNQANCCIKPIVMPTKVIAKPQVSFCEQPIIYPVEYQNVQRVFLVPRVYYAYANNYQCCQNGQ